MLHETLEFILKNSEEKYIFENIFFSKTCEKIWNIFEKFLKRKQKENYLIWATGWTVSCPNLNNPRQRRQKLGMRNCYSGCELLFEIDSLAMAPKTDAQNHGLNISSQLRITNQQVHWVVQVIPYVSKGRSHRDCWYEASYGHLANLS